MTMSGLGGVQEFGCATKSRTVAPHQRTCSPRGGERMPVVAWRLDGSYAPAHRIWRVTQWTGPSPGSKERASSAATRCTRGCA
jgi:hypothetical protein